MSAMRAWRSWSHGCWDSNWDATIVAVKGLLGARECWPALRIRDRLERGGWPRLSTERPIRIRDGDLGRAVVPGYARSYSALRGRTSYRAVVREFGWSYRFPRGRTRMRAVVHCVVRSYLSPRGRTLEAPQSTTASERVRPCGPKVRPRGPEYDRASPTIRVDSRRRHRPPPRRHLSHDPSREPIDDPGPRTTNSPDRR